MGLRQPVKALGATPRSPRRRCARWISDSFRLLPVSGQKRRNTEPVTPSSLFVAAHDGASLWLRLGLASSWTPLRELRTARVYKSRVPGSRQVASRRCGIAIISSPLRSQAGGPKSRVGADSRRPSGACAEPRDDLSPARAHEPGSADCSATRSPLAIPRPAVRHARPRTAERRERCWCAFGR